MNRINEFNLEPGTYQHYKGGLYVVVQIVTHMDNPENGKMEALPDPLVCYRDLSPMARHINGRYQNVHQVYARPLSEFTGTVTHNGEVVKRFTQQ